MDMYKTNICFNHKSNFYLNVTKRLSNNSRIFFQKNIYLTYISKKKKKEYILDNTIVSFMPISCPLSLPTSNQKKNIEESKFSVSSSPSPMAAYGSFHRIFENPRQDKTPKSFLETLSSSSSWNPIKGLHVTDHDETPPFTEIFGELHFREPAHSSYDKTSAENSSLQLCTEGLGSESYYDLEDEKVNDNCNGNGNGEEDDDEIEVKGKDNGSSDEEECGPRRKERREYPPAMARMSFKAYREEGRFVLEEVRIPRREFLRAIRENGRLRLKLVQPEDDQDEDEDEEEEEKDKPV